MLASSPSRSLAQKARRSRAGPFAICPANKLIEQADEASLQRTKEMKQVSAITATCLVILALASCANTIKGVGRDAANTVNATQNAGNRMGNAAAH